MENGCKYSIITAIICFFCALDIGENVDVTSPNKHDFAEETQHAICNISTKDIQTSANASVTRQLRGVCTSKQLDTRFQELEIKIIQELELIKEALHLQSNKKRSDLKQIPNPSIDYEGYPSEIERNSRINEKYILSDDELDEIKPIFSSFKTIDQKRSDNDQNNIEPIFPTMKKPKLKLKNGMESFIPVSTDVATEKPIFWSARVNRETISQLNNTIQTTDNGNIYHYFWQVENFNNLMNKMELYIRSSPFLVLGHELMIQLHPNQPKQNFLFIKLQTPNGFLMKHKFYILQRAHKGQNIESHFLGNLGGKDKFVIPKQLILNSGSLSNGSIIIKLSIFLK